MNSNILEFYVKMKDMMSGGLATLAQNAKKQFAQVSNYIENTTAHTNKLTDAFHKMTEKIRASGPEIGKWAKSIALGVGITGAAVLAGGAAFAKSSLNAAIENQYRSAKITTLSGKQAGGDTLSGQLNDLAGSTGLNRDALFDSANDLLKTGGKVGNTIPLLKMLGDVSVGDASKLKSLAMTFAKVQEEGILSSRTFRSFLNDGLNPLQFISDKTGKSMLDLEKTMKKGAITTAMVQGAFESATSAGGKYYNMTAILGETLTGKMERFRNKLENLKIEFGQAFIPLAEKLYPYAVKFLDWLKSALEWTVKNGEGLWFWAKAIGETGLAIKGVTMFLVPFAEGLSSAAIGVGATGTAATGALGPLALLAAAIAGLVTLYNYLGDAMNRANANSKEFSQIAYDAEKNQLTNIISTFKGKDADKRKEHLLTATQYRLEDYISQTQKEFADLKAMEIKHGVGGTLYENAKHSLQSKGVEMSLYQSQLKAVNDLQKTGVSAADIKGGVSVSTGKDDKDKSSLASSIAGGGPRVINISIGKMVEKLEVHAASMAEGMNDMERQVQEVFLRVLNSGASVQG